MSYEELKEEYIKLKKEELKFINDVSIIGNQRVLSEYEILTIYRRLTDYTNRVNDIFDKMKKDIHLERYKLKKEKKFSKDSVVLEFDVGKDFLPTIKEKKWILKALWIDPESLKFKLNYYAERSLLFKIGCIIQPKNTFKPFYLSCGIFETVEGIACVYKCGVYYYLEYGALYDYMEEIPVNKIEEFEKDKIIIHNEDDVDLNEVKKMFIEEYLNENNKSFEDIRKRIEERIHELSHSRYLSAKKKSLIE